MSTTKPARTYLVLAAILLATTIVAAGAAAYYYSQFTSQQSTNSNLVSKAASLNSDLALRDGQIADLQQKLNLALAQQTTLQTELNGNVTLLAYVKTQLQGNVTLVASLKAQILTLNTQIANLQQQIVALNSVIDSLRAANVIVVYKDIITPSTGFGCGPFGLSPCPGSGTLIAVAWANLGTTNAYNTKLMLNFYSGPSGTGMLLCSVTQTLGFLGFVSGRSIHTLDGLSNSCSTGFVTAMSVTSAVAWV